MAYKQLISFNKSKAGTRHLWCLQNVRKGFSIGAKYPTAWSAWSHTDQHKTSIPTGVDVPLYYAYSPGGINQGHINVRLKNGTIWSDGTIYKSIADYESKHTTVHYVGWSTSINGVAVLKYVKDPAPVIAMPKVGSTITLTKPVDRTTFKNGTTTVAGHLKFNTNEVYTVRGYDKKYKNRIIINSKSGGGNGVALALYYFNGKKITGWK